MNGLSWLIYLADVVGSISGITTFFSVILGIVMVACYIILTCIQLFVEEKVSDKAIFVTIFKSKTRIAFFLFILVLPFSLLVPSKTTMMMIAASEVGQQVVTSPEAQKVFDSLKDRILREIDSDRNNNKDNTRN